MIDLFLTFNFLLILFGWELKIWKQSRTTFFVFIIMFLVVLEWKLNFKEEIIFITLWIFSTALFARAVFRKYIKNSKYRWFA